MEDIPSKLQTIVNILHNVFSNRAAIRGSHFGWQGVIKNQPSNRDFILVRGSDVIPIGYSREDLKKIRAERALQRIKQESLERQEAEKKRFSKIISGDRISTGIYERNDTWKHQLGADTGVSSDFDYLREQEESEKRLKEQTELKRKKGLSNYRLDLMGDINRKFVELRESYGGDANPKSGKQAKDTVNELLKKGLPKFFRNSNLSTQSLLKYNKFFDRLNKLPFGIGSFTSKVGGNPLLMGIGLGLKALDTAVSYVKDVDDQNEKVIKWENAQNLYGKPTAEFTNAAWLANIKDPAQISKLYGQLTMKFGSAEKGMEIVGKTMANADPRARMAFAQAMGLDENVFALADIFSKNGRLEHGGKLSEARITQAILNQQEAGLALQGSSDASFGEQLMSKFQRKSGYYRLIPRLWNRNEFLTQGNYLEPDLSKQSSSLSEFGSAEKGGVSNNENNINIQINQTNDIKSDDPEAVGKEVADKTVAAVSSRESILISQDRGIRV